METFINTFHIFKVNKLENWKKYKSKAFKTEPKKLWFYYETNFQVILPQNFYGYPPDLTIKMNESN